MYSGQWTGVFDRSSSTWKVQGQVVSGWELKMVELLRERKEGSKGGRERGKEGGGREKRIIISRSWYKQAFYSTKSSLMERQF